MSIPVDAGAILESVGGPEGDSTKPSAQFRPVAETTKKATHHSPSHSHMWGARGLLQDPHHRVEIAGQSQGLRGHKMRVLWSVCRLRATELVAAVGIAGVWR